MRGDQGEPGLCYGSCATQWTDSSILLLWGLASPEATVRLLSLNQKLRRTRACIFRRPGIIIESLALWFWSLLFGCFSRGTWDKILEHGGSGYPIYHDFWGGGSPHPINIIKPPLKLVTQNPSCSLAWDSPSQILFGVFASMALINPLLLNCTDFFPSRRQEQEWRCLTEAGPTGSWETFKSLTKRLRHECVSDPESEQE